jgi:RNA polymerase sigma-54 factor
MGSMQLHSEQRQQSSLSPKLQHAVRLLQMSSVDFSQAVQQALGRNPFLEEVDNADAITADSDGQDEPSEENGDHDTFAASMSADDDASTSESHDGASDRDLWLADLGAGQRRNDSNDLSALDHVASRPTLAQHLHAQLGAQPLPPRDRLLAQVIVESLDDDGYLRTALDELSGLAALSPVATADEMALALQRVQSLDPAGIGARNVAECLRLQLPSIDDARIRDLAERIVDDHLHLLAARDAPGLARALDCSLAEASSVCERIRQFDPHPGWRHGASDTRYVIPDVIVRKVRGQWTVTLNPAVVPKVKFNQFYADLFQHARKDAHDGAAPAQHEQMAGHLQEARWTVRNVEQRFSTIQSVAESIVRRQAHFFDYGPMAMKPLGLNEIAQELEMHESTVSRVTNNKYMATPLGVFELKHFFSRAMVSASGSAFTGTAIRELIKDMVDSEPAQAPLSDAEIARQLVRQGLTVARRTVTKYRQLLKIDAVERRRRSA